MRIPLRLLDNCYAPVSSAFLSGSLSGDSLGGEVDSPTLLFLRGNEYH
jgi:hypothetical protein